VFILCEQGASADLEGGFVTKNTPGEDLKDRMGFYTQQYITNKGLTVVAANFMRVSLLGCCALHFA
jgi:hypothetical protein